VAKIQSIHHECSLAAAQAQISGSIEQTAENNSKLLRTVSFGNSTSIKTIRHWLYPNGELDSSGKPISPVGSRYASLQRWMTADTVDPNLQNYPVEYLIDGQDPTLEADRERAIAALGIH
jgi:hypothetical protein